MPHWFLYNFLHVFPYQLHTLFYSPKESALALTVWVPLVRVALISLVYWFQILTTLRTVTFIWWVGGAYFWVKF